MYITLDQLLLIGSYTVGIVGLVITCIKLVIDLIEKIITKRNNRPATNFAVISLK